MQCPTCSAELVTGQKFCPQCGTNVAALTLPPPPAGPVQPAEPETPPTIAARVAPTAPPPTFTVPQVGAAVTNPITASPPPPDDDDPVSGSIPQWINAPRLADPTAAELERPAFDEAHYVETNPHEIQAPPAQTQLVIGPPTSTVPVLGAVSVAGRGSTVLAVIAGIAGLAAIIGAFLPVLTISTDAPIPEVGDYMLNDLFLGTNVIVGAILVGVCLLGGGILATQGFRIGAGLAGGAALALAPVLVVVWGAIDLLSTSAEAHAVAVAQAGQGGSFYEAKQGAGLWVLIAAAALGLVALGISMVQAGGDGRPRLNMVIGLLGALVAVVAALGQMIPAAGASFGDNFDSDGTPNSIVYGRLAMIVLVAAAGAIGFLCNNRWGIGLAIGGMVFWGWQWLSSLAELGDTPLPPGFAPISSTELKPHIVTTTGIVTAVVLAIVAILTAPRPRPA